MRDSKNKTGRVGVNSHHSQSTLQHTARRGVSAGHANEEGQGPFAGAGTHAVTIPAAGVLLSLLIIRVFGNGRHGGRSRRDDDAVRPDKLAAHGQYVAGHDGLHGCPPALWRYRPDVPGHGAPPETLEVRH
eukprot:scaffold789_cov125-Isochrysis_galbana.AAC.8